MERAYVCYGVTNAKGGCAVDQVPLTLGFLRIPVSINRRFKTLAVAIAVCHWSTFAQLTNANESIGNETADTSLTGKSDPAYSIRRIEGWTVHIRSALLENERALSERALELLQKQLAEITRVVPPAAVAKLRAVPLWFSPEYAGVKPKAEYHPGADWLREHGRNEEMVKGVEFTNVREFEKEMNRMPNFALHELAHAYHDQVLADGFENADIKSAYERNKAGKSYDRVERWFGNGRPNTFERAYAMTSPEEYFAECTEVLFSRNDFFPFTREELKKHDPEMYQLLQRLWKQTSLK